MNLFFYIKNKFEDEFNFQIYNTSSSINLTIEEALQEEETREREKNLEIENKNNKDNKDKIHLSNIKKEKNGIQNNELKIEENKKEININNNKICPNIYKITEKLNSEIEVKEEFSFKSNYNLYDGDEDAIIKSSIKDFAKTLEKMNSFFSTSSSTIESDY